MHNLNISAQLLVLLLALIAMANAHEVDDATNAIKRLSPLEFHQLPSKVAARLIKLGCTIPQPSFFTKDKTNVISGNFAKPGQKDYAVLCSKNGVSHIRVIWGGPARCQAALQSREDGNYLQAVLPGEIGYSRAISIASQRLIADYQLDYNGPKPPDTTHEGIEDSFMEKASTIFYCANGKWSELRGAD